ncbi:MAG: diacylglycerol kinase family protein [Verrucomicrobiaceae bacterium]|nr:diacylglycerol kinase family protein [Verrucomicrobiaceae bacterium]
MRLASFIAAWRGLIILFKTQRHARIHLLATAAAVAVGAWLDVDRQQWCWLIVAITMVIAAEGFNTAVEKLADRVTTEHDPLIRDAKDLAAGAVLWAALGAAIIGLIVLGPPLWARLLG